MQIDNGKATDNKIIKEEGISRWNGDEQDYESDPEPELITNGLLTQAGFHNKNKLSVTDTHKSPEYQSTMGHYIRRLDEKQTIESKIPPIDLPINKVSKKTIEAKEVTRRMNSHSSTKEMLKVQISRE